MREQQLQQEQHVAEARVSPSPRTPGRYTKPDGHTASKYRYSMSRDRLTRKCERYGYDYIFPAFRLTFLRMHNKCKITNGNVQRNDKAFMV